MNRFLIFFIPVFLWSFPGCDTTGPEETEKEPKEFGEFIDSWTYRVYPRRNFDVGEFRLWVPDKTADLRAVLILLNYNNSNGLGLADAAAWRDYAMEERLALLGVHFESNGSTGIHYSYASGGSGSALLRAFETIADRHGLDKLKDLPFLIRGYSAGGSFASNFSEFLPERTIGFSNIRGWVGGISTTDPAEKEIPPALILLAENESESKTNSIAETVFSKREKGANWSYAVEPGIDHYGNLAASDSLSRIFFSKTLPKRLAEGTNELTTIPEQTGWLGNNETKEIFPFDSYPRPRNEASWLVDEEFADAWKNYQEK